MVPYFGIFGLISLGIIVLTLRHSLPPKTSNSFPKNAEASLPENTRFKVKTVDLQDLVSTSKSKRSFDFCFKQLTLIVFLL